MRKHLFVGAAGAYGSMAASDGIGGSASKGWRSHWRTRPDTTLEGRLGILLTPRSVANDGRVNGPSPQAYQRCSVVPWDKGTVILV